MSQMDPLSELNLPPHPSDREIEAAFMRAITRWSRRASQGITNEAQFGARRMVDELQTLRRQWQEGQLSTKALSVPAIVPPLLEAPEASLRGRFASALPPPPPPPTSAASRVLMRDVLPFGPEQLDWEPGVALWDARKQRIWVLEANRARAHSFDREGRAIDSMILGGLFGPVGAGTVFLDAQGQLCAMDQTTRRILRFDEKGFPRQIVHLPDLEPPIVVMGQGSRLLALQLPTRQLFTLDHELRVKFLGRLELDPDMTIDASHLGADQQLFVVASSGRHSELFVYDLAGQGRGRAPLSPPVTVVGAMAVDVLGFRYLTCRQNGHLAIYSPDGRHLLDHPVTPQTQLLSLPGSRLLLSHRETSRLVVMNTRLA